MIQSTDKKIQRLELDIKNIVNGLGLDNEFNVPDYILAKFTTMALFNFGASCLEKEKHEGLRS